MRPQKHAWQSPLPRGYQARPVAGHRSVFATAAMLHLAAASPGLRDANESSYHQLLADILIEPHVIADGMMTVPQSPGLGVEVDRAKVERFALA